MPAASPALPALRARLRAPRAQLGLLVLISALVGAMLGMDRAMMAGLRAPLLGLGVNASAVGFIAAFGLSTALSAAAAGLGADRWGWRRVLVAGWVLAAPAPFLIRVASSWGGFHAANVLYGLSLGLLGSATAVGVIDLAGPARRGWAVGLHDAAGTVAMALSAHFIRVMVADQHLRHSGRLALGLGCVLLGGVLAATLLREARPVAAPAPTAAASGRHPDLAGLSSAGLITTLNDGVAWGLVALAYGSDGIDRATIVALMAVYPATAWVGQLLGGALSDRVGRRPLIKGGMGAQALAIVGVAAADGPWAHAAAAALLGLGAGACSPALLAAVADAAPPARRASAIGAHRAWRALGFIAGALLPILATTAVGQPATLLTAAALTLGSGLWVAARLRGSLGRG